MDTLTDTLDFLLTTAERLFYMYHEQVGMAVVALGLLYLLVKRI
jgi:hypothetical protein